jgi:hypothetical protein
MAGVTPKLLAKIEYIGKDNAMNPCGKCGRSVSEIWDFRFNIYEEDLNVNRIKHIEIPVFCPCVNIDELNLEEPLDVLITKRILLFIVCQSNEIKIREVLTKYIIYLDGDIDIIIDRLKYYLKQLLLGDKDIIDRIKLFREIYEEFAPVYLKPAKQ